MFRQEFVARKKWQFFESAQDIFFSKKARIRWLECGDANTQFFYKAVVAHQLMNAIHFLQDARGMRVFNQDQIKQMVIAYFQNLLGSADGDLQQVSVAELQGLLSYRCPPEITDQLISIPTDEEIQAVFFAMPKNKAPGPDGFSAEFFMETWQIVGKDSVEAVKEFFQAGRMLRQFNLPPSL